MRAIGWMRLVLLLVCAWQGLAPMQGFTGQSPKFTRSGELIRPLDYRDWMYVTSGLGMTYGPSGAALNEKPRFDNVFVTRKAYQQFLRSGLWPDKTMFILEIRRGNAQASIDSGGHSQGEVVALEAAVKDRRRFPDGGWAYFSFDQEQRLADQAAPLPRKASCYSCHKTHTAVDNTFVQFYPTLFEVAKRHGTIKADYDPARKVDPAGGTQ